MSAVAQAVVATVPVQDNPRGVAVDPGLNKIYVVNNCGNDPQCNGPGTVTVIDGTTLSTQNFTVGYRPYYAQVNPVSHKIYISNSCGSDPSCNSLGTVTVVDGLTLATHTVAAGASAGPMAVDSITGKVYVDNFCGTDPTCTNFAGTITVIDETTLATQTVTVGSNPADVAVDTTDVILDINGYFAAPGAQTYQFYSLPPCRLLDTRNNQHGGTLQPGVERDYIIAGHCGIPTTATAYSFNVTVVPTTGKLDYLTVWPKGEMRPNVSTLNDPTGTVVANAAIVPAGANNATAFYASAQPTDLILDVNGYFAPAGTGGLSLYPVAPCRVLDTRNVGTGQPFQGTYNSPNGIEVLTSPCAPPSTSKAFVFNATVVPPFELPYLTLWPHGRSQPNVSTLNAADGAITSNMAIVPTNDGSINAYAAALTQLILDISGYFAP
jgi:hypothetical protein